MSLMLRLAYLQDVADSRFMTILTPFCRLFSLGNINVTSDTKFSTYLRQVYMPNATDDQIAQVAAAYPEAWADGSPFDTGLLNALTPEYKRLAAIQGDLVSGPSNQRPKDNG